MGRGAKGSGPGGGGGGEGGKGRGQEGLTPGSGSKWGSLSTLVLPVIGRFLPPCQTGHEAYLVRHW